MLNYIFSSVIVLAFLWIVVLTRKNRSLRQESLSMNSAAKKFQSTSASDGLLEQNRFLRLAAETAECCMIHCDENGRLLEYVGDLEDFPACRDKASFHLDFLLHSMPPEAARDIQEFHDAIRNTLQIPFSDGARPLEVRVRRLANGRYIVVLSDLSHLGHTRKSHINPELLLGNILDNLPCSIFIKDMDENGKYVLCNKFYYKYFNPSQRSLIGKTDFDFYPEAMAKKYRENDQKAVAARRKMASYDEVPLPNGRKRYCYTIKLPITGSNGHTFLLAISMDITKLVFHEKQKRLLLDNVQIPIMLFNENAEMLHINRAASDMVHKPKKELLREPCYKNFCNHENSPLPACPVRATIRDHKPHQVNWQIRGRDYAIFTQPVLNAKDHLSYVVKSLIDITDFNESQKKLTVALEDAQAASRAKSYFLATISHELRTPLNAVIGFSELLLQDDILPEERNEYYRTINLAGNALLTLVNDVLDLSKIEADRMPIIPQSTDLEVLLNEIMAIFQPKIKEKNIQLQLLLPEEKLPQLRFDNLRLRQILLNLIGNAVKFTSQGTISVQAEFQYASHTLAIVVADTGSGIEPDMLKKLFLPFEQQNFIRGQRTHEGTGLGLTISHQLVQRMNGRIEVESKVNVGSTFRIVLNDVPVVEEQKEASLPQRRRSMAFQGKVLIIDDILTNLKLLALMLKRLNIEYVALSSSQKAFELVAAGDIAMVITDLWMPELDGIQLAHKLRGDPRTCAVTLVAATADVQLEESTRKLFDAVLFKPITIQKLTDLLHEIC